MNQNQIRMYRAVLPEVDDVVMVEVTRVTDSGVYATLLEYNIEGLMILSEVSKQRWKRASKTVPVGRKTPALVLRVDETKGYVDLSKKRVSIEDAEQCRAYFAKSKTVHAILAHACDESQIGLDAAYARFGWDMYGEDRHALDALKRVATAPDTFFATFDVPAGLQAKLAETCGHRLAAAVEKIEAVVEVTCFTYEGIEAVKEALRAGAAQATAALPLEIRLLGTPRYAVRASTADVAAGVGRVGDACAAVRQKIVSLGGAYVLAKTARVVADGAK